MTEKAEQEAANEKGPVMRNHRPPSRDRLLLHRVVDGVCCAIAGKFAGDHKGGADWPDKSRCSNATGDHQANLCRGRTPSDKAEFIVC
jgi:hypothetical protein